MVKFNDETNTSLVFQFNKTTRIVNQGSFLSSFESNIIRSKRAGNVDILQKTGIKNTELPFTITFRGSNMVTDAIELIDVIKAQTTIYLDTEGFYDDLNTTYVFEGKISSEPYRVLQSDGSYAEDYVELKFKLLEINQ